MKKIVAIAVVCVLCLTCAVGCAEKAEPIEKTYLLEECRVYDVGKYEGEIAIIDDKMDIWVWREPTADVSIGDKCALLMCDNGTFEDWYDDYIVEIYWEEEG